MPEEFGFGMMTWPSYIGSVRSCHEVGGVKTVRLSLNRVVANCGNPGVHPDPCGRAVAIDEISDQAPSTPAGA